MVGSWGEGWSNRQGSGGSGEQAGSGSVMVGAQLIVTCQIPHRPHPPGTQDRVGPGRCRPGSTGSISTTFLALVPAPFCSGLSYSKILLRGTLTSTHASHSVLLLQSLCYF